MKTGLLTVLLLGLVLLVSGCPPTKYDQPRDTPVTVAVGKDCYVKITDTITKSEALKLWKSRPINWKNKSDKVVVVEFDGEPLIAGRDLIRLRPGESVTTLVSSRMKKGKYKYVIRCLKDRKDKGDRGEEEEKTEDEYEVEEPPPIRETGGGPG